MRVTKAIREYVEEEITKKYDERKSLIGKEYYEEQEKVTAEIGKFLEEANAKAKEYLQNRGWSLIRGYPVYGPEGDAFTTNIKPSKPEIEKIIRDERSLYESKRRSKIKQVLFDLEMGETAKAELKDVLDNIEVD